MSLEGKVAIVTGGGRGIGRAIALDLAKNGADIVLAARTVSEIESVAAEVRALGRQAVAIPTDMMKETEIINLINQTHEQFGKIDILVNNAGASGGAAVIDMKTEDWDRIITVNLRGVFIATREALKKMKLQKEQVELAEISIPEKPKIIIEQKEISKERIKQIVCPQCGKSNAADSKFCVYCSYSFVVRRKEPNPNVR